MTRTEPSRDDTRTRITQQHGKHQIIDLAPSNAVDRGAHADAPSAARPKGQHQTTRHPTRDCHPPASR